MTHRDELREQPSPRGAAAATRRSSVAPPAARALALQRQAGNRAATRILTAAPASGRVLQRKTARELLERLHEVAGPNLWMPYMDSLRNQLIEKYADVELGMDYKITSQSWGAWWKGEGWTVTPSRFDIYQSLALALSGHPNYRNQVFADTADGKVLGYLLGLRGAALPPLWGKLGDLHFDGTKLVGRPNFGPTTVRALGISVGADRRHITAWHNIRALLNDLIAANKIGLLRNTLRSKLPDNDAVRREAEDVVEERMNAQVRGGMSDSDAKTVLKAAYVMFNQTRNLWVGQRAENQEIGAFTGKVKGWIDEYAVNKISEKLFFDRVAGYPVYSQLALAAQAKLALLRGTAPTAAELSAELEPLEVDMPQAAVPPGGAVTPGEAQAHQRVFQHLSGTGAPLSDGEIGQILLFLMNGRTPTFAAKQVQPSSCTIM